MKIGVHKVAMAAPNDVSELAALIAAGTVDPARIVALIGKTEGNGGANDFTRGYATLSYQLLLAPLLGLSPEEVGHRIAFVWSGGTEGVLSPHATVLTRDASTVPPVAGDKRLALGIATTRTILPEEVGTMVQVREVARAVRVALAEAGIADPADVHYVQVKGPLLTPASVAEAEARGRATVTRDPNGSKPYARGATALGVALALGEVAEEALSDAAIARRLDLFSTVASTSAGGELTACEVLLFGNAPAATSDFRIGHAVLRDVIDADAVLAAMDGAGLATGSPGMGRLDAAARSRIAAVFAKAEASPTGRIRGRRNTMLSDADIHYERHARAALGAVIASVTGDPAIFVSGGTEHQCAPGEAPIAAIMRV
ncbi:ring-opening amidohydrolase [Methylobacterium nonmethylotrophicum]|uniref:Cyclic amide hydrolase n=1 Tax=Methylobacterium nonmethylotrophicum TaxID=1141884 RepID=A0A4Z0NJ54_9HYPH|nr:ring-opening amidohydrolase [Methylobacterium nonmethylotrophicum]TGD96353.1 ring-opening amidohydrolase [Methylobacterium nonmethylotrophicum]